MLVFDFSEICETYKTLDITRRNVLKILAMFYDLIGLLQPILINLKRLFQEICKQNLSWDELLPDDFKNEFEKIMLSLQDMEKISIDRNALPQTDCQLETELHGFSDASLQSYGACVYIRAVSNSGVSSVHLITSKSRLAPIKGTTIPRLELLGNVLLSRLMASVKNALSKIINTSNNFYWTDLMITLAWITSKGKNFKTFVENRVREIRENTNISRWFYYESKSNPAGLLTCCIDFVCFQQNNLWWRGGTFLTEKNIQFSQSHESVTDNDILLHELKTSALITKIEPASKAEIVIDIYRFNSFVKLYGVFAWIYRFYDNLKNKTSKSDISLKPFITAAKQTFTELFWMGQNQKEFSDVRLKTLSKDLILIYDEKNLIRCEGRF